MRVVVLCHSNVVPSFLSKSIYYNQFIYLSALAAWLHCVCVCVCVCVFVCVCVCGCRVVCGCVVVVAAMCVRIIKHQHITELTTHLTIEHTKKDVHIKTQTNSE